ncbi:Catalase [Planctomycetales bacterium 10988]|nr:Catalase [Planctomycetales bacterium 10988]
MTKPREQDLRSERPTMTTNEGLPVGDNQNSRTAGRFGPITFDDFLLFEKTAHFNRERIPERVVHAKGSGAFGTFTVTNPEIAQKYCKAKLFETVGKQTEMVARFSTVGGEKGSADAERDPRGFALKFYTEEGNWDMVGNNTPVFFIRDPLKFSDFIHTQKRMPASGLKDPQMMWDFWSMAPESLHQVMILFSDRGIPATYRHMNGYSSHTFSVINHEGERFWIKIHCKTQQGIKNLRADEAQEVMGKDPDHARRDLNEAIEAGKFPKWKMFWQIMPEEEALGYRIHPFDLSKVWPHSDYPLTEVGEFELNRNPENFFAEIEQVAFSPVNIVPGIGYSPDKMLQGRLFSYPDAHRYRLGTNYQQIPVNKPKCPMHSYNKDGQMRVDGNSGGCPVYEPNTFAGPIARPEHTDPALKIDAEFVARFDDWHSGFEVDDYQQPGDLYRLMNEDQKEQLVENLTSSMESIPERIKKAVVPMWAKCDQDLGERLSKSLGVPIDEAAMMV